MLPWRHARARPSSSHARDVTKPASVSESFATNCWRVGAGSRRGPAWLRGSPRDDQSARRCGRARTARSRPAGFRSGQDRLRRHRLRRSRPTLNSEDRPDWRSRIARPGLRSRPRRPDRHRPAASSAPAPRLRPRADRRRGPRMTAGGAFSLKASARASSARTSGDGSSSSMMSAPSAAARSSGERSE